MGNEKKVKDMINRVRTKKVLSLMLFVILSMGALFIVFLYNFTTYSFDIARIRDQVFWANYLMTLMFGVMFMFITLTNRKDYYLSSDDIKKTKDNIRKLKETLMIQDEYEKFIDYVKEFNDSERLMIYKKHLQHKLNNAKKQKDIDKYKLKLKTINEDIENIKITGYKDITPGIIFEGMEINEKKKFRYTGRERFLEKNILGMLGGVIINAIVLTTTFTSFNNTADAWARIVSIAILFINYSWKGLRYAQFSVNDIYKSVLQERKTFIINFLIKNGYEVQLPGIETENLKITKMEVVENAV